MKSITLYIVSMIIRNLPETRAFGIKRILYRWAGATVGKNVRICSSVRILGAGNLEIGDNTWIGHETLIVASSNIKIGKDVDIAPRVFIGTGTHIIDINSPNVAGEGISKDIKIGDGCWLCVNTSILPGVEIGKKSIVGAGAVVTKSFVEESIIIAGIPAKELKRITHN